MFRVNGTVLQTGSLVSAAVLSLGCSWGEPKSEVQSWSPGRVYGIEIGRSTKADVVTKLGTPSYEGPRFDEEADPEAETSIWLEYSGVDPERTNRVAFVADPRTYRIVEAEVTPRAMSLREAEALFGSDYITRTMATGPCPPFANDSSHRDVGSSMTGPRFLVYPQLGLYLIVEPTNSVRRIVYLSRCGAGPES